MGFIFNIFKTNRKPYFFMLLYFACCVVDVTIFAIFILNLGLRTFFTTKGLFTKGGISC